MTTKLKLRAENQDDIVILSSVLQDAILRVGEIRYGSRDRHIDLRLTRYNHESAQGGARILCGLRIDGVMDMKSRGIDRSDPEAMMVLLSLDFKADDAPPGGLLHLIFAGGGVIQARVEAIDMILADISEQRLTDKRPLHPLDG